MNGSIHGKKSSVLTKYTLTSSPTYHIGHHQSHKLDDKLRKEQQAVNHVTGIKSSRRSVPKAVHPSTCVSCSAHYPNRTLGRTFFCQIMWDVELRQVRAI